MTRPAIVYLHGFRSSPASAKASQLRAAVDALPASVRPALEIPALVAAPGAAIAQAGALVGRYPAANLTIVGSSLGGYYATHLAERYGTRAALVNPAVRPYDDLAPYVGVQTNLHTGAAFEVTPAHFDELRALRVARITDPGRYLLMVETGDEVLDYAEAVAFYAGAWQFVRGGGDHAFRDFAAQLPALLRFAGVEDRPSS
jgi:predicted esterase YcpF (UPF0227 family)